MKVLYIGYYNESSDWGRFTTNNILALQSAGVEVACRPIHLGPRQRNNRLQDLENKDVHDCDVCIQHVFPEHMVGTSLFGKNIGILTTQFNEMKHTTWVEQLNQLDEVWVTNQGMVDILKDSLDIPVSIVPMACDIQDYMKQFREVNIPESSGKFKFYTIIDEGGIQSLSSLLACYHSTFDVSDPTALMIAVVTHDPQKSQMEIDKLSSEVKKTLRLGEMNAFSRDIILPIHAREATIDTMLTIHNAGDCYVDLTNPSAWSMKVADAMALGKTPIVGKLGGNTQIVDDFTGNLIDGVYKVCQSNAPISQSNNGKDFTFSLCDRAVKDSMVKEFLGRSDNFVQSSMEARKRGLGRLNLFSIDSVGKIMKEKINAEN